MTTCCACLHYLSGGPPSHGGVLLESLLRPTASGMWPRLAVPVISSVSATQRVSGPVVMSVGTLSSLCSQQSPRDRRRCNPATLKLPKRAGVWPRYSRPRPNRAFSSHESRRRIRFRTDHRIQTSCGQKCLGKFLVDMPLRVPPRRVPHYQAIFQRPGVQN